MHSNTGRIAKNTLILYFRQIVVMLVSLYTVRLVLNNLGTEDYGIYNIVGGVVVLFTFMNSAMTNTTQRFLNFALGKNDTEQVRNVFSISFIILSIISLLFVLLAQTFGLFFFNTLLNIPTERQSAAFIVYQLSIVTTVIGIYRIPYNATILAYEKMSFFALLSLFEAGLKLLVVLLLPIFLFDMLIMYAILILATGVIITLVFKVYCNRTFETARFKYTKDKKLLSELANFSGWSLLGDITRLVKRNGVNILLNIFHGVTVNAAMGIATNVNAAIFRFVGNFQTAFKPQIVKSYSTNDHDYFIKLIFTTSKLSFCLLLFFVLPLLINLDFVLGIWLGYVPEFVVIFTKLFLLSSLIEAIDGPLWMSIQATGNIKKYQLILSCFMYANLPLSFLFLRMGFSPAWPLIIKLSLDFISLVWRIFFLGELIKLPVSKFFRSVIMPVSIVAVISTVITNISFNIFKLDLLSLVFSSIISTIVIGFSVYFLVLNRDEKDFVHNKAKSFFNFFDTATKTRS